MVLRFMFHSNCTWILRTFLNLVILQTIFSIYKYCLLSYCFVGWLFKSTSFHQIPSQASSLFWLQLWKSTVKTMQLLWQLQLLSQLAVNVCLKTFLICRLAKQDCRSSQFVTIQKSGIVMPPLTKETLNWSQLHLCFGFSTTKAVSYERL